MTRRTTYLAGSIQDAHDGGVKWREKLTPKLEELGIEVLDPTKSEANLVEGTIQESKEQLENYIATGNWEAFDKHMEIVIETDIHMVKKADFIICFLDHKHHHGGTYCELWEASEHLNIPIYVVSYDPKREFNTWMLRVIRRNGQIFENFGQLIDFLTDKYGKKK